VNPEKLLVRLQTGVYHNVSYADFCRLVEAFGFRLERTRGSHQIYRHAHVPVRLNIQNRKGEAKPYQVRQLLAVVEEYSLTFTNRSGRS